VIASRGQCRRLDKRAHAIVLKRKSEKELELQFHGLDVKIIQKSTTTGRYVNETLSVAKDDLTITIVVAISKIFVCAHSGSDLYLYSNSKLKQI